MRPPLSGEYGTDLSQEATFSVESRISLSWIVHGQIRMSTSSRSLLGPVSGSRRLSTIGFDGWLLNTIAPRNSSSAGPFTGRAVVEVLRPHTNSWTLPSVGLAIQIHGSKRRGKRERGSRSSSHVAEPY